MDRITKNLLDEFVAQNALGALPEDQAFEQFAGYLLTSAHYSESFAPDDIAVGAGGDCGIDCIAVIVNGALVTEPEEVQDLAETNGYLDVTFVLVQAERSSSFETAKIGQFAYGARDFFAERPQLPQNERVKLYGRIAKELFDRSRLFKKGNPHCVLYYATTGRWTGDANLVARRDAAQKDVQDLGVFSTVVVECIDAERLHRLSRAVQNAVTTEVLFEDRTVIPEIPGVEQAYLGLLPAPEFMKLIENEGHDVITSIFYDNVRHWQEWNPVNSEIKETLADPAAKLLFPLLNNGVTVVARRIHPTGNRFLIEDYQVVNGCQTSYVLHESRAQLTESVMVPVRLIATLDDAIKNRIIKATNRQTQVTEDQLLALSDFPKKLEAFFPTFDGKRRLYYERRSRQYNGVAGVEKVRVITMTALIRAFASVFLAAPHRTTRNYRALLRTVGTDVFHKDHRLEPYYASAYMHYRLEFLFRNQTLPADLKPARYHLMLAYRAKAVAEVPPGALNSNDAKRYSDQLAETLWDDDKSRELFVAAEAVVRAAAEGNLHRDHVRTEPFTVSLLGRLGVVR